MPSPTLHYHPLSSYCQKALIAVDALGADVERRLVDLGDPAAREAYLKLWPLGKMPLLVDRGRVVPEATVIIEYLQQHHAADGRRLLPEGRDEALDVRLWDRLMDLYVMTPMQALTADLLQPEAQRNPAAVERARQTLLASYGLLDRHLKGRTWLAGEAFSLADCAAASALFYAITHVPFLPEHTALAAYFECLVACPSVARTIDEARPHFHYYPGRAGLAPRFYQPRS